MGLKLEISKQLDKKLRKRKIPKRVISQFLNTFQAIALAGETNLFDIKKLKTNKGDFYRLRIGSYRGIFRIDHNSLIIEDIEIRGEVYKRWEQNL